MRRLAAIALALTALAAPGVAEAAPSRVVASAWVEGTYSLPGVLGYRSVHFTLYADGHLLTTGRDDARGVTTYEVAKISPRESRQLRRLWYAPRMASTSVMSRWPMSATREPESSSTDE